MAYTYTADTIIYEDTETEQIDIQIWFSVPLKWAEEWCKRDECYQSLEKFDETYTWDDSYEMFISALEQDEIICTRRREIYGRSIE